MTFLYLATLPVAGEVVVSAGAGVSVDVVGVSVVVVGTSVVLLMMYSPSPAVLPVDGACAVVGAVPVVSAVVSLAKPSGEW